MRGVLIHAHNVEITQTVQSLHSLPLFFFDLFIHKILSLVLTFSLEETPATLISVGLQDTLISRGTQERCKVNIEDEDYSRLFLAQGQNPRELESGNCQGFSRI